MSSEDMCIRVQGLSKRFELYAKPIDRLRQMFIPRLQQAVHRPVHAYFKEFWALQDVSFNVARGETVGIVGRNGSGKSTLLQIICDTLTPTLGQVHVAGRIAALLELGAGFNPEFSGRENVRLSGLLYGLSDAELQEKYASILEFAEIGDFIDQPVKTYSSGMYVRLAFAVAINVSPDILVVDEALSVGDEAFQRKCFARIEDLRDQGATVLFVSHSAGAVIELCDRAILLDGGELLTMGSPKYVISRYHKLLYSPAEKYMAIREAIAGEGLGQDALAAPTAISGADDSDIESVDAELESSACAGDDSDIHETAEDGAYYEEGMMPKSTFRYEPSGAAIVDPHVETPDGRRVNILQPLRDYVYVYRVKFERSVEAVRCGMLIKTVTGLELVGSVTSWNGDSLPFVEAGTELEVRFAFSSMFVSGSYFLNAGVQAKTNGELVYLDRWIDGAMFKVMHEPSRRATTKVDLGIESTVLTIKPGVMA